MLRKTAISSTSKNRRKIRSSSHQAPQGKYKKQFEISRVCLYPISHVPTKKSTTDVCNYIFQTSYSVREKKIDWYKVNKASLASTSLNFPLRLPESGWKRTVRLVELWIKEKRLGKAILYTDLNGQRCQVNYFQTW